MLKTLGLALRAKKLLSGTDMVIEAIRKGQIYLVIVAEDASDNTKKMMQDKTTYYKVPLIIKHKMADLSNAIAKKNRAVIGITDAGFAKILQEKE